MFLMNQWYAAALPSELTDKPLARTICGQAVVMYRAASGRSVALADRCPHRYAPLSAGTCSGDNIVCPYHGIVFDPTGACARIPHQPTIPQTMRVRAFSPGRALGLGLDLDGRCVARRSRSDPGL